MEFDKQLQVGNIKSVERKLDKIFNKGEIKPENFLDVLISEGYDWHCGGMSDPFQPAEKKFQITKQNWLYENLADIIEKFKVVSFDNLAIDQLNVRRLMSDDEWNEFYMGDDGTMTYYIDMVERKFARSSTAAFDKRYDLLDSVDDMFQKILSE